LLTKFKARDNAAALLQLALKNTDTRLAEGKSVTPAFLYAALLWPVVQLKLELNASPKLNPAQQFNVATNNAIAEQLTYTSIPKRFTQVTKEIWELQARLETRNRRAAEGVFDHPRFRAAYDFLLLREDGGENLGGVGAWWTEFQEAGAEERERMLEHLPREQKPRRKSRRRKPPRKES
jgi:poly(A) polymerase